jgi:glyoxylase-like metal-dependent hydrolase (beta-lactamase superfamily II)
LEDIALEIAPGIHRIPVALPEMPKNMISNLTVYLVTGKNGWTLIDAGWNTEGAFKSLEQGLGEVGAKITDISRVILTHSHLDHYGLASRIKNLSPSTEILAHRIESELIKLRYLDTTVMWEQTAATLRQHGIPDSERQFMGFPDMQNIPVVLPTILLSGGEIIDTGLYKLEIIWTPGHSPGHICLYEPKNRLLFSGDHVLPTISPNVGFQVLSGENPLKDYLNALRKVRDLSVTQVLPAHEYTFSNLSDRVDEIIEHHKQRQNEILTILHDNHHSAYEIAAHVTWNTPGVTFRQFPPMQKMVATTETIAHLEYICYEGQARKTEENGRIYYGVKQE